MSTEIPISIRIKAEIEGATEVADLVNNLEKLKSLTGSLGQTMKETGEKGQELTKGMEGVSKISPEAREAAHGLNELRDSAIESQEGMVKIGSVTMPLTEYMRRLKIETQEVGTETGKLQERLVNAAKSSGVYFEGLEDVSAAMRDQSALMGFRKQLLGSLITSDYNKAAATQYLTGELHGNAQAARILVDSYTTLQSAGFTLKSVFGSISIRLIFLLPPSIPPPQLSAAISWSIASFVPYTIHIFSIFSIIILFPPIFSAMQILLKLCFNMYRYL